MWNAWSGDRYQQPTGFGPIGWIPDVPVLPISYPAPAYDRHLRRSGDDYVAQFADLYPQGQAWPRSAESEMMQWVSGMAQVWGDVDGRADDLLVRESDPRATLELLPDWERNFGLPDECLAEPYTLAQRHAALVARMTMAGGQSRQFFYNYAAAIGQTISITEHSPFTCGLSQCGDTTALTDNGTPRWELGNPTMRFFWSVNVAVPSLTWFRCGGESELGKDPFLQFGLSTDLECIWNRLKPAHTILAFTRDLSALSPTQGA